MISRRQLLTPLAAIAAVPNHAFAQVAPGGRGQQQRDTTPLVPPFEATGSDDGKSAVLDIGTSSPPHRRESRAH